MNDISQIPLVQQSVVFSEFLQINQNMRQKQAVPDSFFSFNQENLTFRTFDS